MFNRLVIFTCNDYTWHGNPEPANCPENSKRIFITLSYLSKNFEDENKRVKAFFIARPSDPLDEEKDKLRALRADPEKCKEIYKVNNMSIPKIFFTYWEGNQLSQLHYYTIYSLQKLNPEINIIIYTSLYTSNIFKQWNTNEHSIEIQNTVDLECLKNINKDKINIIPIDFKNEYCIANNISVVFKADFIRIAKLYEHGGMWFDMDILFIKPIPCELFERYIDLYYFSYSNTIPTGLLFSRPKNNYLNALYTSALENLKNISSLLLQNKNIVENYQMIGPNLWIQYFRDFKFCNEIKSQLLETSIVYPFEWHNIDYFFNSNDISFIKENTFGVHWYNGGVSTKHFINSLDIKNIDPSRNLCEKFLYEIINN